MSAQHAPHEPSEWVDDRDLPRVATDAPIREIAPDDFVQSWDGSSFYDAIRRAEAAPTSTPTIDRGVCPSCGSEQVSPKSTKYESDQREAGDYKCLDCGEHCDTPEDADKAPGEQAKLPGVRKR